MWQKSENIAVPDGLMLLLLLVFFLSDILPAIYHERQTYLRTEAMQEPSLGLDLCSHL